MERPPKNDGKTKTDANRPVEPAAQPEDIARDEDGTSGEEGTTPGIGFGEDKGERKSALWPDA